MKDRIIMAIKDYVRSLDEPDNTFFQENKPIIQASFSKAIDIVAEQFDKDKTELFNKYCIEEGVKNHTQLTGEQE